MSKNLLPKPSEAQAPAESCILAQKIIHKGALLRGVGAECTIPVSELFGVRIVNKGNDFLVIEVITSGISNPQRFKFVSRPKIVMEKKSKPKIDKEQKELKEEGI